MTVHRFGLPGLAILAAVSLSATMVATPALAQDKIQLQTQDQIYGSQLMTPTERSEYSAKMRNLKTEQERNEYRYEHHRQMQDRARARGVTLPDSPPAQGAGAGPGAGPGAGMGPGAGTGAGTGMGSGGGMGGGGGGGKK
jgi:hypothetical protein